MAQVWIADVVNLFLKILLVDDNLSIEDVVWSRSNDLFLFKGINLMSAAGHNAI